MEAHFNGISGVDEVVPRLVEKAQAADERIVGFVRKRPIVAVAVALAAGYVVGRLISRFG